MRGRVCCSQLLLVLASAVIHGSESHGTHDHIILSQIWDSPNLESHVLVFISPRNRVAELYPQAMGSLFVVSYDSQGCDRGIRTHLHAGSPYSLTVGSRYTSITSARTAQKMPFPTISSIVAADTCLLSSYQAMTVFVSHVILLLLVLLLLLFWPCNWPLAVELRK
jgi:hypothetical protein